ncbi:hypothetical protein [Nitrosomonas ureae]|uniref:Uncharacterized protein n=1 Tax=Nitrosomonas ureae TaxID=44577 RepID=A0A1H9E665_9PROT|nr:hypothetical protein [Nitrosomonas ureae]SEQ20723.1 hypothetical protein SAMN05421510_102735 [Nitrosomonas ureae]
MITIYKILLTTNVLITVVTQALKIVKNNIFQRINSLIGKIFIFRNSPILAEHSHKFVLFTFIIIGMTPLIGGTKHAVASSTPVAPNSVKWHPGHYYAILNYGKNSSRYLSQVYKELQETPALRGIQIRYRWAELEQTEDEYNFSSITKRLSELSSMNKRLVIVIDTKASFDSGVEIIPEYLKANKYEGGEFIIGYPYRNGRNIKLWNQAIHDRLTALIRALGQQFNSHPHFEGIGISDSSFGKVVVPLTLLQKEDYYANLLSVQRQMRNYFPNTLTFQFTSHPRSMLKTFIGSLGEMGAGLGGPRVSPEMPSLFAPTYPSDVYGYFPQYSGIMPLVLSVKHANYENTKSDLTGHEPTVLELLSVARDALHANYIFWTRHPKYYSELLEVLKFKAQNANPSGGLNSLCPSVYSSCVN